MDMNLEDFNSLLGETLDRCMSILRSKRDSYANDPDPLHNFKVAAAVRGCSVPQALSGMMVKHTVRLYDMLEGKSSYPPSYAEWVEVLGDHLNYLLILSTIISYDEATRPMPEKRGERASEQGTAIPQDVVNSKPKPRVRI